MPPHPNIMTPAKTLVTIDAPGKDQPLVCGSLYPFIPNGTLSDQIETSYKTGVRLQLPILAKWCYEMVAAVHHTHLVAHTYHMDFKPGNILLDENLNLVLIDWEQSDTPVTIAAPEMDGTWDVEEVFGEHDTSVLKYTKYSGPERRNMPESTQGNMGWHIWNIFLEWSKTCPKALEMVDVFSLARSMWMLLRQPDMDAFEDIESTEELVGDWDNTDDIPVTWKEVVKQCLDHDPNKRMSLDDLLAFWSEEKTKLNQNLSS